MARRAGLSDMEETKEWAREQALRHRDPALIPSRAAKIERMEIEDGIPWIMKQVEKEWKEIAAVLQDKADIYRASTWLKDQEAAPRPQPNWYDTTKAKLHEKVVEPLSNPRAGSFIDRLNKLETNETASLHEFFYQDAFQSAAERTKAFLASETADIKEHLDPALEKHRQFVANELEEIKKRFYEPVLQPIVQELAKDIADDFRLLDSQVYQPYIKPLVASIDQKIYQPYVRAVVDGATDWVNRNIYYPIFAPVEEDVHEYIGQPVSKWWKQYGEWVHGALDVVGFIPGFGDMADFINGFIYLAEGRKLEATLSMVSGIPAIGYFGAPGKALLEAGQGAFDKVVKTTVESFGVNVAEMGEKQLLQEGTEKLLKETGTPLVTGELLEQGIQLAGTIPGAGSVATSLTSLIQLSKGKTLDGLMSAFSMVPIAGGIVATMKRTIAESLQRTILKQVREEATEKLAKELAELGSERLAKEAGEVIGEKAAKEAGEDLMVKSIKETGEKTLDTVAKNAVEETAEKTFKETSEEIAESAAREARQHLSAEIAEASVAKTTKQTFEEAAESAVERAKRKMREDSLVEKVTETDNETETKREFDVPVREKGTQVIEEREHKVLSGELKRKYDSLVEKHGKAASDTLDALSNEHKQKLLEILDTDSLGHAIEDGPEAVQALAGWSAKELQEHGPELAVRAKRDAVALSAVKELVESGPIDPKNLTDHQRALIEKIAEYSTQNGDRSRAVLGKWTDISSGFVKHAQDTNSLHYNPHPDMWKMLGALGENRSEVAWLVNKQVIQTGINKGLAFEYTLSALVTS